MSNQMYDLDEKAKAEGDHFKFILGGNAYKFKYPTVEESESIANLKDDKGELDAEAVTAKMYSFIEPVEKTAPAISEAIKKVTSPVLKEFNRMVTEELGIE